MSIRVARRHIEVVQNPAHLDKIRWDRQRQILQQTRNYVVPRFLGAPKMQGLDCLLRSLLRCETCPFVARGGLRVVSLLQIPLRLRKPIPLSSRHGVPPFRRDSMRWFWTDPGQSYSTKTPPGANELDLDSFGQDEGLDQSLCRNHGVSRRGAEVPVDWTTPIRYNVSVERPSHPHDPGRLPWVQG